MKAEIKKAAGGDIRKAIRMEIEETRFKMVEALKRLAEEVVKHVKDPNRKRWTDQTSNLKSSIGYCILDNGKPLLKPVFKTEDDAKDGEREGRKFMEQVIAENPTGLVFIMVAGMPYAKYVEAMNLDVFDSAEMLAEKMIPIIMNEIGINVK